MRLPKGRVTFLAFSWERKWLLLSGTLFTINCLGNFNPLFFYHLSTRQRSNPDDVSELGQWPLCRFLWLNEGVGCGSWGIHLVSLSKRPEKCTCRSVCEKTKSAMQGGVWLSLGLRRGPVACRLVSPKSQLWEEVVSGFWICSHQDSAVRGNGV